MKERRKSDKVRIRTPSQDEVYKKRPRSYVDVRHKTSDILLKCDEDTHLNRFPSTSSNASESFEIVSPSSKSVFKFNSADNKPPRTNTISATKLVATLSPMIKRKVISAMQSVQASQENTQPPPRSNLFLAILAMIVCLPIGILAWHHAKKVSLLNSKNEFTQARASSKMAATFSYIGFISSGLIASSVFVAFVLKELI